MAIPFAQSMRSLHADRGTPSLAGLGIAIVLLAAWSAWFFWAPITRYETGTIVRTTRDGNVVAEFPAQALGAIAQGQTAYIRLHDTLASQVGAIPALVSRITDPTSTPLNNDAFQASLFVQWDPVSAAISVHELVGGAVEVEVESVSPATLVARASGQFVDTSSVSFSPQHRP